MKRAAQFLKTHRTTEIAILALIVLTAATGWFNSGIPKGDDYFAGIPPAVAAKDLIFGYHTMSQWTDHWYLGYPLFYMFPSFAQCLLLLLSFPLGWVLASKFLYLSFFILAAIFAYFFIYELTRNRCASFIAGLVYAFAPYTLLEIAFAGLHACFGMAHMLAPIVFLAIERAIKKPRAKSIVLAGILLALLTLTHPQTFSILFGPFLGLYVIFRIWLIYRGKQSVKAPFVACVSIFSLGLLLTAFWWFPLIWEADYLYSTHYFLADSIPWTCTFLQAITLSSPGSFNSPESAYSLSSPILFQLLRLSLVMLVLAGIIFNYKNKYVWFFAASAAITIILAMGLHTPIYAFAHDHIPFFSSTRVPARFLEFTVLAYAVLAGFGAKSIVNMLKRPKIALLIVAILSLLVTANTWQEARAAFQTFQLTTDQQGAISWLSEQDQGRVLLIPPVGGKVSPETGLIVNPLTYNQLHGKEIVPGGAPSRAPKWTGDFLNLLYWSASEQATSIRGASDILGIKYAVVDKENPVSANFILDDSFSKAWESPTIDIYQNQDPYPRVYALVTIHSETLGSQIAWKWAEGSQEWAEVSKSSEYLKIGDYSWKSEYSFDMEGHNWLFIGTDVAIAPDVTSISLSYYSPQSLADLDLRLRFLESDGSMYECELAMEDSPGWHDVEAPISLFYLRWSEDENMQLDNNQISEIWIGVDEIKDDYSPRSFSVYFSPLIMKAEKIESADFSLIHPGKYQVRMNSATPFYLILSESYYPGWVAKVNGETIPSERVYGFLNGWYIDEAGEYELTLEFTESGQREAGTIISFLALGGIPLFFIGRRFRTKWRRKPPKRLGLLKF